MNKHMFVMFTYVPLIITKVDDSLEIGVGGEAQEIAQNQGLMGCWFCHTPLNLESFDTTCEGSDNN